MLEGLELILVYLIGNFVSIRFSIWFISHLEEFGETQRVKDRLFVRLLVFLFTFLYFVFLLWRVLGCAFTLIEIMIMDATWQEAVLKTMGPSVNYYQPSDCQMHYAKLVVWVCNYLV